MSKITPRSILYTPAINPTSITKALSYDSDVHLLDLEDSVPPPLKAEARQLCAQALESKPPRVKLAVRINEMGSHDYILDMQTLLTVGASPDMIVMTMVCAPREIELARALFQQAGQSPLIYVTIETPEAVTELDDIARVSDGLILGSADLSAALGVEIGWENMLYARQMMAVTCAKWKTACIDTACFSLGSETELLTESRRVKSLGFHGKVAVHPKQLSGINSVFRPTQQEIDHALRVVQVTEESRGRIINLDGQMIGPPFVKKARRLIEIHAAFNNRE